MIFSMVLKRLVAIAEASIITMIFSYADIDSAEKNIISGLECGMTSEEAFEAVGIRLDEFDYIGGASPINDEYTKDMYCLNVENVSAFGINMDSYMFLEISSDDRLVNFGYHIGSSLNDDGSEEHIYTKEEIMTAYNAVYSRLSEWYGKGNTYPADEYSNISDGYEWFTEQGDIWAVAGEDLWGIKGQNEIIVSCSKLREFYGNE